LPPEAVATPQNYSAILRTDGPVFIDLEFSFSAASEFVLNISQIQDEMGNYYDIDPISVKLSKKDTLVTMPLNRYRTISPLLEEERAFASFRSAPWEEITSDMAQSLFDLVTGTPPQCTMFLPLEFRYFDPLFDSSDVRFIEQTQEKFESTITCPDRTIYLKLSVIAPRTKTRWFVSFSDLQSGFECPLGSTRNAYCPNCPSVFHRLYATHYDILPTNRIS